MKKISKYIAMAMMAFAFIACEEKPLDPNSQVIDSYTEQNDFDKWLVSNYVEAYNIDFKYRMEMNESQMSYWLVPAEYNKSIVMSKLVRHLCLEAYDEITGSRDFIKEHFPKMIHLIGSAAYKNNGTMILGEAEGGLKITLYMINNLMLDPDYLNYYYFKTMHHEFAHILHQKKPYSTDFNLISGSDYVTDAWSDTWSGDADAQKNGFISEYASKEANEDFVELIAVYVTSTAAEWNSVIKNAGDGAAIINAKFDIVYNYMLNTWGINLDDLREVVQRRQSEIETLDLETL
jgi:substrate import-associated zinc metallohydrolase lipoprotein